VFDICGILCTVETTQTIIEMPRRKGKNQTAQSTTAASTPVIFAKCNGCQVSAELQACQFCQYPECAACIEKHREADKLSERKAMLEARIDCLRQQTGE
jgi:hypothetical protein